MLIHAQPVMYVENPLRQVILGHWVRTLHGFVWHHGIVTGFWLNPADNAWHIMVTHATPNSGVFTTTLDEFCKGTPVEIVAQPLSAEHQRSILITAQANLGKPYALFNLNCEHFASFCYSLRAESRQLQSAVGLLSLVAATALIMNSARS